MANWPNRVVVQFVVIDHGSEGEERISRKVERVSEEYFLLPSYVYVVYVDVMWISWVHYEGNILGGPNKKKSKRRKAHTDENNQQMQQTSDKVNVDGNINYQFYEKEEADISNFVNMEKSSARQIIKVIVSVLVVVILVVRFVFQ